jgi:ribonuclease HI
MTKHHDINPRALYTIHVDGASRGNPGPAGAGGVVVDAEGTVVGEFSRYLGRQTNNYAEYAALWLALAMALGLGMRRVEVFADSDLMVRQVNGVWKAKHPRMQAALAEVRKLVPKFEFFSIRHVRREYNSEADRLANRAVDEGLKGRLSASRGFNDSEFS